METNKSFIIRLIAFLMAALVLPCIYLAIRFNLFKSKMAISIWGIIIIGLILIVVSAMIKFYLAGMKTKWSYLKQILEGFIKVILPILFILVVVVWAKTKLQWLIENINLFIEAISVILGFETVAIIINPLSKWAFDNNVDGMVSIADKIFKKGTED